MLMNQKEFKKLISDQSDLSKMDFTDLCLKNLEISDLDLRYVSFVGSNFENVKFENCDLGGAGR